MKIRMPEISQVSYIVENLPYGILIEDSDRKIHTANQALIDIFNIPLNPEQMHGLDCKDLAAQIAPYFKNKDQFIETLNKCLISKKKQGPFQLELISNKYVELNYIPYYSEGAFLGHSWCYADITVQKESENKIVNQTLFFKNILNSIPADIVLFSPEHKYLFINSTAIKDPALRKWMIGKTDYDFCAYRNKPTSIADERRQKFQEVIRTKKGLQWEDQMINREGKQEVVLRILHPYINEKQEIEFLVGYGIDVTDFKEKTLKLSEEETKTNFLKKQIKNIVFTIDSKGFFEDINPVWGNITGYSIDESIGLNFLHFIEDQQIMHQINEFMNDQGRNDFSFSFQIRTKTELRWMEAYILKERYINQNVKSIWGMLTDIDEQKKEQQNLISAINKEKELNELKSQFVNMVSHEVRTPLAGILSSVELLQITNQNVSEDLKDKNEKYYNRIKDQILRIGDLMNDVLLLSRIEAGVIEALPSKIDLIKTLKQFLFEDFNINDSETIKMIIQGKPKLIPIDWKLMQHVFTNLLSNALKYSKGKPKPVLKLSYQNDGINIIIQDYGIGIPKQDLNNLFTPFRRGSNVGNISGTGLGLVLVKYFVELHNGKIEVTSEINQGTIFSFYLPYGI